MNAPYKFNESLRPYLCGLGHLGPPSPRVTLAEITFHLFLCEIQPTVSIRIANPRDNLGGRLVLPQQLQAR